MIDTIKIYTEISKEMPEITNGKTRSSLKFLVGCQILQEEKVKVKTTISFFYFSIKLLTLYKKVIFLT